jgi:hypothetical protein
VTAKNQTLTVPTAPLIANNHRSVVIIPSINDRRASTSSDRPLDPTRPSNNGHFSDRQFVCVLNDKPLRSNAHFTQDTITLVLQRDKRILDFGFSISDRLYGTGVYVNKIRPNGPAELEGTLIPCMRIYRVWLH